jgi:hypothetical protein
MSWRDKGIELLKTSYVPVPFPLLGINWPWAKSVAKLQEWQTT